MLSSLLAVSQLGVGEAVFLFLLIVFVIIILASSIRVVTEYERIIVFRLGRLIGARGPGVVLIIPVLDRRRVVDLRIITLDVPKQRIITRDNVTVDVDAVVYFRVEDPISAVMRVKDFVTASANLAQTTLRDIIGQVEFDDLLTRRDELNSRLQKILDEATEPWGIKVSIVAIRDVVIPENMQRAIAKQAEAERERRSRVIMAEGELQAAQKMTEAAAYYTGSPAALRLRELQTWTEVAREKNMIIVTEGHAGTLGTLLGVAAESKKKT